jgi:hypothetical protein
MTIGGIGRDAQFLQLGDSGGSVKRPPPPTDTITTGCRLRDPQGEDPGITNWLAAVRDTKFRKLGLKEMCCSFTKGLTEMEK